MIKEKVIASECCRNCYFFRVEPLETMGNCHKNPPVAYPVQQQNTLGFMPVWPPVQGTRWCGEWKPLEWKPHPLAIN